MLRMSRGPSTKLCMVWAIGIISDKISAAIEFEFYENNEKWSDVDESIIVAYRDLRREIEEVKARNGNKTGVPQV